MPLVLGVDAATAATTVEVRDADSGRLVASGSCAHPPLAPDRAEQDPSTWWSALLAAVSATERRDIAAMAVAGQQHALVVIDSAGAVLRPAILSPDRRASSHARRLSEHFAARTWVEAVGMVPGPESPLAKLAWLRSAEPDVFGRIGGVLGVHDWLTFRLTGRTVTDHGDASGTGYFSPARGSWRTDILHRLDAGVSGTEWARRLPTVLGPTTPADWMTASVHEIVGLRGRPIVAGGTGRQMAVALGLGLDRDEVGVSLGASGGVFAVSQDPVVDPTATVRGYADATGRFLPTVPLPGAFGVVTGLARILGVDLDGLGRLAESAPEVSTGLAVLPASTWSGGVIGGIDAVADPGSVAMAALQGVACAVLDGIESIVGAAGHRVHGPINVAGAAARSSAFCRVLADLANVRVAARTSPSPVARGACVQAAAVLAGCSPTHITDTWEDEAVSLVEPAGRFDAAEVRAAYAALRMARRR